MSVVQGQRALELAVGEQRWSLQGGHCEDGLIVLRIAVLNGGNVGRREVILPLGVDGDEIQLGEPELRDGWSE